MVWSGLVCSGLIWSGLVWSGLVWSGLVWSGLVNMFFSEFCVFKSLPDCSTKGCETQVEIGGEKLLSFYSLRITSRVKTTPGT